MAIPQQVLDMEAAEEAAEETQAETATPQNTAEGDPGEGGRRPSPEGEAEATPDPQPTKEAEAAPDPAPAPATDDERNVQRLKSMLGRIGAVKKPLEDEIARLKEENAALQRQVKEANEKAESASRSGGHPEAVTDEEVERARRLLPSGRDSSDDDIREFLADYKAATAALGIGAAKGPDHDLAGRVADIESRDASRRRAEFVGSIEADYPGFFELSEKGDARLTGFLDRRIPFGGGRTYAQYLADAIERYDRSAAGEVISAFADANNIVFSPNPNADPSASIARPRRAAKGPASPGKPVFRRSEVNLFTKFYQMGKAEERFGISADEADRTYREIELAEEEGRIADV